MSASRRRSVFSSLMSCVVVAVVVAVTAGSSPARAASTTDTLFEKGNQAYLHGDYKGAIDAYEQVVAAGVVAEDLHYNLANAYVKADRLGPAVLHYELALALDPTQEDARANLKLVREQAGARFQDKVQGEEKDPFWVRSLQLLPSGNLTLLFLGVYTLMFVLALGAYLLPSGFLRVLTLSIWGFALIGTVAAGGLLGGRWWLATRVQQAIVLPDELAIKEGPDANYQTSFLVHAGLKVRLVERDQDWIKVRLGNGLEGWTRDRDVGHL